MKFYEEIECEHGWTDDKGFAHCDLGTSCCIADPVVQIDDKLQVLYMECYCDKDVCPIYEEDEILTQEDYDNFWWW
jgi:hypothetical protein